jgi:hypothetical protein
VSMSEHILALCAQIERDQKQLPDRIVVSPSVWEALLYAHQDELKYDVAADTPRLVGLAVQRSPQLASGFALFKGDKLLTAIL